MENCAYWYLVSLPTLTGKLVVMACINNLDQQYGITNKPGHWRC